MSFKAEGHGNLNATGQYVFQGVIRAESNTNEMSVQLNVNFINWGTITAESGSALYFTPCPGTTRTYFGGTFTQANIDSPSVPTGFGVGTYARTNETVILLGTLNGNLDLGVEQLINES